MSNFSYGPNPDADYADDDDSAADPYSLMADFSLPKEAFGVDDDDLRGLSPVNSTPLHPLFKRYVLDTLRERVGQTGTDLKEDMTENQITAACLGLAESLVSTLLLLRVQRGHIAFGQEGDEHSLRGLNNPALRAPEAHLLRASKAIKQAQKLFLRPEAADLRPGGRMRVASSDIMGGETAATFGLKQISSMFSPLMDSLDKREKQKSRISALQALMKSYADLMVNAKTPGEREKYRVKYQSAEEEMQAIVSATEAVSETAPIPTRPARPRPLAHPPAEYAQYAAEPPVGPPAGPLAEPPDLLGYAIEVPSPS